GVGGAYVGGDRQAAFLPAGPHAVEQADILDAPELEDPPDAGGILVGGIVVDDDPRVGGDAEGAEALGPGEDVFAVLELFGPFSGTGVNGAGDMAGLVGDFVTGVED